MHKLIGHAVLELIVSGLVCQETNKQPPPTELPVQRILESSRLCLWHQDEECTLLCLDTILKVRESISGPLASSERTLSTEPFPQPPGYILKSNMITLGC